MQRRFWPCPRSAGRRPLSGNIVRSSRSQRWRKASRAWLEAVCWDLKDKTRAITSVPVPLSLQEEHPLYSHGKWMVLPVPAMGRAPSQPGVESESL